MTMLKFSPNRHAIRRLMIAPAILTLATGLISTAYAQDKGLGSRFEAARMDKDQAVPPLRSKVRGY